MVTAEMPEVSEEAGELGSLDMCSQCSNRIALRTPNPERPTGTWLCKNCGSVYLARCYERNGRPYGTGARFVPYDEVIRHISAHVPVRGTPIKKKDMERLVQCLEGEGYEGPEKRTYKRYRVAAPVTVIPLAENFRFAGLPFKSMVVNVSSHGAAIVYSCPISEKHLLMDFAPTGVTLMPAVLKVIRIRPLGQAFEIGGEFLSRLSQTP